MAAASFIIIPAIMGIFGAVQFVIGIFTIFGGVITGIVSIFGVLGSAVGVVLETFTLLSVFGITFKAVAIAVGIFAIKLLIIGAIIGVIIFLIIKFRKQIMSAFKAIWEFIKPIIFGIGETFKLIFDDIMNAFGPIIKVIVKDVKAAWKDMSEAFMAFADIGMEIFEIITKGFNALFGDGSEGASNFQETIVAVFRFTGAFVSIIITKLIALFGFFFKVIVAGVTGLVRVFATVFKLIFNIIKPILVGIKNVFIGFFEFVHEAFSIFNAARGW